MVGGYHKVGRGGQAEIVERLAQLRQVVVGIFDAGHRRRAVDTRRERVEAVAGVVLGAVRIPRPEHKYEWFAARLEQRQYDFAGDIGEIGLLNRVGHQRTRRLWVSPPSLSWGRAGAPRA